MSDHRDIAKSAKSRVCAHIDGLADLLLATSHDIHANPELCYEEHHAHRVLTDVLEEQGLTPIRGAYGIETAFEARAGTEGPEVAVLCEYDALPGIGHACGHNIIAAAGLGAGLAGAAVAEELGGRLRIIGTPAEEGGGGKIRLIDRGAFEGIAAALMVHPSGSEVERITSLAVQQIRVVYRGSAAHAAAAPEQGINALDGAVLGYVNVAALRQHIAPDERIHGIIVDGGQKANIVPERAEAHWYARSPTRGRLDGLKARLLASLEAGAAAAGCDMEHEWIHPSYDDVLDSRPVLDAYLGNARSLGRDPRPDSELAIVGSTDLGNLSYLIPSIHPMIKAAPEHVGIHTLDFAAFAGGPEGDRAVLDGAKAMAMTLVDCWTEPSLLDAAAAELAVARVDTAASQAARLRA
ncbi:MAG: M20 family metallopeptidase [Actinobacteria bacterium]|nr:M20 family metallopeptidase [Actinomycetota bacterium]